VGFGGAIIHYNGATWRPLTAGTSRNLFGVWGSAGTNVFAVGDVGLVLHGTR